MITNINVGIGPDTGTGDKLRNAFIIVNENFDAIDAILTGTGTLTISQIAGLQTALDNIQTQLDYIPGLQTDINSINNTLYTINQTLNSQNNSIADLYDEITNLQNQIYTKISEAPIDGVTYGRQDGAWVVVGGITTVPSIDEVLAVGSNAFDKSLYMNNTDATITTSITPDFISLINGSNTNTIYSNKIILEDSNSGSRTSIFPNIIEFWGGATQYLKGNPAQNVSFLPSFLLPAKNLTANWTLATTVDYTLQAVTTLANTTNNGIQFQPILNTGTGSKYVSIANSQVYLFSQSEGYSIINNDKILWSRFGNIVTLSGWGAAGSNSADFILPTKPFATYTLATTDDLYTITSGNPTMLNITGTTAKVLYVRGLTNSNGSILLSSTGSNTNANWAWNVSLNPDINYNYLQANTASTAIGAEGRLVWNDIDGTLDLGLKGGNVTLQIGQETVVRVVNKTTTNVDLLQSNYQAVRLTGAQGQRLKVDLAIATNDLTSAETIGLVTETILNNEEGFVTTSGLVRGINTTGSLQSETWLDGDILYLSPSVEGQITNVKPIAPDHLIIIGYVVRAHITQGTIFVKVDNGYELDELHNVKITGVTNSQVLQYNGSTQLWENQTPVFGSNPGLENWSVNYGSGYSTFLLYVDTQVRSYGSIQLTTDGQTWTNNTTNTLSFNISSSVVWIGDGNPYEIVNTLSIKHSTLGYLQSSSVALNYSSGLFEEYATVVSGDIILQPGESFNIEGKSRSNGSAYYGSFIQGKLDIVSLFVGQPGATGATGAPGVDGGLSFNEIQRIAFLKI